MQDQWQMLCWYLIHMLQSNVWPRLSVVTFTWCLKDMHFNSSRNSLALMSDELSTCMLKFPVKTVVVTHMNDRQHVREILYERGMGHFSDLYNVTAKRPRCTKVNVPSLKGLSVNCCCPSTLLSISSWKWIGIVGWRCLNQCGRCICAQPGLSKENKVQV